MRTVLLLSLVIISLLGCNDGDFQPSTFNFDAATIQRCNTFLLKINRNEALFLEVPEKFIHSRGNPRKSTQNSSYRQSKQSCLSRIF
jgi:hypothetical protein